MHRSCPSRLDEPPPAVALTYTRLHPATTSECCFPLLLWNYWCGSVRSAADDAIQTHATLRNLLAYLLVHRSAKIPAACRTRPGDVAVDHDTCYDCEQRLLNPDGEPGALPWRPPLLPGCDFWCHRCSRQRCCVPDPHDLHVCMRCERLPPADPTPAGGGDPWAAVDEP